MPKPAKILAQSSTAAPIICIRDGNPVWVGVIEA
jgi:hypothetical protein